jgi:hypothetical protein
LQIQDLGSKNILIFKCRGKIIGLVLWIIELLHKKMSLSSQKYGVWIRDPGSGKYQFRFPDPGVKKAPDPGSGSATLPSSPPVLYGCGDPDIEG